mmetsp:Transcript_45184/g.59926  ORF Transcript_45184/g.59926 Transcript_45184/m.59926 type:complete len:107 (-) Transcript_45184:1816-2136(-)|eukprot:CAMPEP_0185575544 /NCGR_PEP_ID=MMETSP0434-20130131/6706_1 /TAXON_ID=626734 ORGANISM="Favella taraikaensis, Strain Fe Narragansett Bay" /NCGR_SAMPLE_ID=MMETSP0434 /ASSEMBLY_ACC=CAM_ASM_000379 /LENGTH=106 /DNA_ID=CAMNT_0028192451 /DNA_START=257 /DNA_END=577 /DNA_ORIENTATION=+
MASSVSFDESDKKLITWRSGAHEANDGINAHEVVISEREPLTQKVSPRITEQPAPELTNNHKRVKTEVSHRRRHYEDGTTQDELNSSMASVKSKGRQSSARKNSSD